MKKLTLVAAIFLVSCQYHSKDETVVPGRKVKALQQQTLNSVLLHLGISGPHELLSIQFYNDPLHQYADVLFRNTLTGIEKNILVQKADQLNEFGKTYLCYGSCSCNVRAVLEPNGTWGAQCTCADCVMMVFSLEETQDFFG